MKFPFMAGDKADFLNTLAPIVVNEYLYRKLTNQKVISPTVVIAQAALESGWNLEATSLFGIKGEGLTCTTKEYINGEWITIEDSFKKYPSLFASVQGYYDLMQWSNYDDATSAPAGEAEVVGLTNDIGYKYATAPNYKDVIMNIINDYNLWLYNDYVYQKNDRVVAYDLDDILITKEGKRIYTYTLKEE